MSRWEQLIKPALREVGAYHPGPSLDQLMARHGLQAVDKLNWNEGLWGPLPGVLDAAAGALHQAWAYPEHAYDTLREAIGRETGAPPEQVLPGHGIQALILTLVNAFVSPGDRVVIPAPTYGLYAQACRVAGAHVERVASPALALDLEAIAAAVGRTGARIVWICDPNNPTGLRLGAGEWRAFLDAVGDDCLVVVDEAYADYVAPAERLRREDDIADGRRIVVLRTFSKIFGLAGLRLGYLLGDPELVHYLHSVQEPFNVNRAALAAGVASLGRSHDVGARRDAAIAARERLTAALRAGGMAPVPSAANFVLVDLGVDDAELTALLLARGILVRPGTELGLPGWARITVAPDAVMDRAAAALLEARAALMTREAAAAS
ncbi:MAG: histidinol-phosphate aminotransferase [Solirubrobacteraceae bacterium]|nr:histidinol-phosphate aminotransferase [Solirubrobacteraceae bacterium]